MMNMNIHGVEKLAADCHSGDACRTYVTLNIQTRGEGFDMILFGLPQHTALRLVNAINSAFNEEQK